MNDLQSLGCEALNLYLDGELDTLASVAYEKHLEICADCQRDLADFRAIRGRLQSELTRQTASGDLARRISDAIAGEVAAPGPTRAPRRAMLPLPVLRLAAAAAVVVLVSSGTTFYLAQPSAESRWIDGVVNAHERAMLAGHEIDVVSSNRHTVKPWFSGKTAMAPLVVDLADAGYPLLGGRLDVPVDHAVPAIIYGAGPHVLSLYMRPAEGTSEPILRKIDGFSILEWRQNGFVFTAVTDADGNEARAFQKAFAAKAATMP
jgi:anti-sigma factor RsiW